MGCEEGWVGSQEREGSNRDDQGCSGVEYVWGGSTDPRFRSYDPAMAQQPGILFSTGLRDATPVF